MLQFRVLGEVLALVLTLTLFTFFTVPPVPPLAIILQHYCNQLYATVNLQQNIRD